MSVSETILSRFDAVVRLHADRVGVEGSTVSLSYRELDAASRTLAAALVRAGVGPGDFVPLLMGRSPAFIAGVLGVLRLGAAYAPIDPESPEARRATMLEPLCAKACLVDDGVDAPAGLVAIRAAELLASAPESVESGPLPDASPSPDSPAYVMYTSGSTGAPKGVVIPHRGVVRLVVDADYASFGPDLRWGLLSAVAFDASTLEIWGALLNGGCCVVQEAAYPSLDELARFLKQNRVESAWLTGALFNAMVEQHPESMQGLRQLLTGGERESIRHMRLFKELCPDIRLVNGYGPTENTTFSLCRTVTSSDLQEDRVPIGHAIRGSTERVTEPGRFDAADQRDEGELLVGGEGLALGYLGREDLTKEKFVVDSQGVRWYRTGDLVRRLADGSLVFMGRIDRQVKIRGHRIEPDEIEAAMAGCRGVLQAAVLVRGETGEDRHLVGVFVPERGATEAQVRTCLEQKLPRTMIPGRLAAVREMPRGATGKLDRRALDERLEELAIDPENAEPSDLTPAESSLVELMRRRLRFSGPVESNTRFASIGGHSLAAMRLCADIQDAFGVAPAPIEILQLQTVELIASRIESLQQGRSPAEPTLDNSDLADEVGDIRRRVLLESERDPTGRAMLVHQAWVIRPGAASAELQDCWRRLLCRHDALRTAFRFDADGVHRVGHDPASDDWFIDEGALPTDADSAEQRLPRAVLDASGRRIDADSPPVRVHAWRLADDASLVVAAYHHAAVDEWSLELIEAEIAATLAGEQPSRAPGYASYVAHERRWLDDQAAERIAEKVAATEPPSEPLPESGPQTGIEFPIDAEGIEQLIDSHAARTGVSPAAYMLSLFGRALRERYGDAGRWVMTPVSKRITPELQRLVGCCLDMRIIDASADPLAVEGQIREAQGETVLPIERVIERIRKLNPVAVGHATRFGFTYRVIEDAERSAGERTLRPITVPQLAARFGIALHVERRSRGTRLWLEASASSTTREDLHTIARSVLESIHGTDATPPAEGPRTGAHSRQQLRAEAAPETAGTHTVRMSEVLATLWTNLLGSAPSADDDFYASGGSSLKAMQLGAAIHDRTGLKLHVGEFLREPTFEGLLRWVREDRERPYALFKRGDRSETDEALLAIPGSSGRAVDLHAFWTAYSECEPGVERMIGCDLVTIANELAPDADEQTIRNAFFERITTAAIEEIEGRPLRIMGYSLGGTLALGVASMLLQRGVIVREIILLDSYAPPYLVRSRQTIAAKLNARLRNPVQQRPAKTQSGGDAVRPNRELWRRIHYALATWKPPKLSVPAVLVQSATAQRSFRPLLHAESNGLRPYLRGPLRTVSVEIDHLKMLTSGAEAAARAAADGSSG